MTEPMLIGTRGWQHAAWEGNFYPAELPADWQFCFYSNRLRSVLIPAERWSGADAAEVRRWKEDSDAQFRFVLELPTDLASPAGGADFDAQWAAFRVLIDSLHGLTAGLLLRVRDTAVPDRDWLAHALSVLTSDKPVCVDLPPGDWRSNEMFSLLENTGAGLCWHGEEEAPPRPGGRFMLGLSRGGRAKALRQSIESLAAWQRGDSLAGLFIEPPGRPGMAEEARLIAEILGK